MEYISKALFFVANSMLIPDIIALLILFVISIVMLGTLYGNYSNKRRYERGISQAINTLTIDGIEELTSLLPTQDHTLFISYLRALLTHPVSEARTDYLLSGFYNTSQKRLMLPRFMTKAGPMLGLMGTLIAMSPALVGLSLGDISGMAYNMQIVFATTVVGLIISLAGIITLTFHKSWYAEEMRLLEYVADILEKGGKK